MYKRELIINWKERQYSTYGLCQSEKALQTWFIKNSKIWWWRIYYARWILSTSFACWPEKKISRHKFIPYLTYAS